MGLPAYRPRRNFFMKAHDRDRRFRFGQASRWILTCDYSSNRIGGKIVALYSGLLGPALWSKLPFRTT
jgi:hypothetical protein